VIDIRITQPEEPFRVVVVSTGDVSRGPAVQRVLRAHLSALGSADRVVLSSAGTAAASGLGIHPHMARALSELTADAATHLSRPVSERRLAQADLILAVSRAERRRVAELRPAVQNRTFTVVEFARLVAGVGEPVHDPRRLVAMLAGLRTSLRPVDPGEDDLEDPSDGEYRDHERLVRRVDHAARDIARGLSSSRTATVHGVPDPTFGPYLST
jgi:protein-tyrosine phosphatase